LGGTWRAVLPQRLRDWPRTLRRTEGAARLARRLITSPASRTPPFGWRFPSITHLSTSTTHTHRKAGRRLMLVNPQNETISAAMFARAARELATKAYGDDAQGWIVLDYHAWLHAKFDGERMSLDAARSGVGGASSAARR